MSLPTVDVNTPQGVAAHTRDLYRDGCTVKVNDKLVFKTREAAAEYFDAAVGGSFDEGLKLRTLKSQPTKLEARPGDVDGILLPTVPKHAGGCEGACRECSK